MGRSATLSPEERHHLFELVARRAHPGLGHNSEKMPNVDLEALATQLHEIRILIDWYITLIGGGSL